MPPSPSPESRPGFSVEFDSTGRFRLDDHSIPAQPRDFSFQTATLSGTTVSYRSGDQVGRAATSISQLEGISMVNGPSRAGTEEGSQVHASMSPPGDNHTTQVGFNQCCFHLFQPVEAIIERIRGYLR